MLTRRACGAISDTTKRKAVTLSSFLQSFKSTGSIDRPTADHPTTKEPIAIVGFALKFPQDVTSEENLWKLLMERRSTRTEVPSNRWNLDGFYKPHGNWPGTVTSRGGHFIAGDPARFDAPFFSIQPAEAECMDPQQRFLLETSYHALENAGIPMEKAMGTRTSVHVGCLLQEYSQISQRDTDMPGNYQIVGSSGLSMLANRLSWFYDFTGPSMTVDTACSGSLLSVHLACQDLLSGNVDMALACGSNLSLVPDSTALLSALNMMSPDSICYSFDERANGYSRSEGFGVILMKRLSQAIKDGDTVRAIIRTTGCNQDGHTPGITQPSQSAQERLTRETYQRAGLDMAITRYFEAHGTGTQLGDPTEAGAISNVFVSRTPDDPLYIGALKSNIGHPEAASGIAGMIKTALVLEAGVIPPNMYPERISPFITAHCPNLKFPLAPTPWPTQGVRRASVNSFGYGGTNVHVVLDDALSYMDSHNLSVKHRTDSMMERALFRTSSSNLDSSRCKLLVVSAFDEYAVKRSISSLEKWLQDRTISDDDLEDLAFTLSSKRSSFAWKASGVVLPNSISQPSWSSPTRTKREARLCFVFTGQGATHLGMGRELFHFDAFRRSIHYADEYLKSIGSTWSAIDELYNVPSEDSSIHLPELSQAVCTIVQVALIDLLSTWNVRPSVVVGHSSGEIAAAYATGAISREAAWSVAYFRGLAVAITHQLIKTSGSMVVVQATPASIASVLDKDCLWHAGDVPVIACYNSPTSLTIAGSRDAILRLTEALSKMGTKYTILDIDVAYHSNHMEPVGIVYRRLLQPITYGEQRDLASHFMSTVSGELLEDTGLLRRPEYWVNNLLRPVQFAKAVDKICGAGAKFSAMAMADMFIEVGPRALFRSPIREIIEPHGRHIASDYTSVLVRDRAADVTALECAGVLYSSGVPVDLAEVNQSRASDARLITSLPPYPFNDKTKYWLEGRTSAQYRFRKHVHHEFLGTRVDDWNECEARWTNRIMLDQSPWLRDHKVNGMIIFPAAGFMVMALEAVRQVHGVERPPLGYKMRNVNFPKAVALAQEHRGTELQLTLRTAHTQPLSVKSGNVWDSFTVFVYENKGWVECCSGEIAVEYQGQGQLKTLRDERQESFSTTMQAMRAAMQTCHKSINSSDIYDAFDRADLVYGPFFRVVEDVRWDEDCQAIGSVPLQKWKALDDGFADSHLIHPATLDAILQMTFPAYSIYSKNATATTVPTGFRHAWFSTDLAGDTTVESNALVHAKVTDRGFRNKVFSITAALAESEVPCFVAEMETATIGSGTSFSDVAAKPLYKIEAVESPARGKEKFHVIFDESSEQQKDILRHLDESATATDHLTIVAVPWTDLREEDLVLSTAVFIGDLDSSLLGRLHEDDLSRLKQILTAAEKFIWVAFRASDEGRSPTEGLVPGLARTLATENESCRVVSVALDAAASPLTVANNIFNITNALLRSRGVPEDEYIEHDGVICVPRVIEDRSMSAHICAREQTVTKPWSELDKPRLTIGTVGRFNTLHFEQTCLSSDDLGNGDILIEVRAVGLSNRDLLIAQGQVHKEAFGSGFAGLVSRIHSKPSHGLQIGTKVFGITQDAVSKVVRCKWFQVQTIEPETDFCEAATYPVAYCTAYYALVQCTRVKTGESVLIHGATSEVGQATIQLAKSLGYDIFVTIEQKHQATSLSEAYGIPRTHMFSNRTLDFGRGVRQLTLGRGIDVVINSLTGEAVRESWDCLATFGRLIDVSATQSTTNLPMGKGRMFVDVDIHELAQTASFAEVFMEVVRLLKKNKIAPATPLRVFKQSEVEHAFQFLKNKEYTGRAALEMASDEVVQMVLAPNSKPLFQSDATYILAGGFGGIGQSVARWMVGNGVKHLILPSRTVVEGSGSSREDLMREFCAQGANIRAPLCDIADAKQLEDMLRDLNGMPPIKGCIQAAMNVRDSSFANMTLEDWHASLSPKLAGSWNLHQVLPKDLDFFIMFSSSTGIMGSFGQSNYTAGNTYQDALAAHRVQYGQRAHTIAMSMVTGVGWVAENAQVQALLKVRGMLEEVSLDDIYELLRYCCNPENPEVGPQIITPLSLPADLRTLGIVEPLGSTRPIYSYLHTLPSRYAASSDAAGAQKSKKLPIFSLQNATTLGEATDIITEAIQNQLSSLLVVSKDDIDPRKPIHKYGVDSLVAVEMRNWFAKGVGADVGTIEILGDLGIAELAAKVVLRSKFVKEELKS
ncbi:polyketide synthase [Setomelanomma holmii]|uniref:Polyketide synthase n=1 Tax=Setomelanomma holmii TaxID=210430 RepID=A0A9P4HM37_9PLEO|nr:polyketide synthase [Setomelanomma holmii]